MLHVFWIRLYHRQNKTVTKQNIKGTDTRYTLMYTLCLHYCNICVVIIHTKFMRYMVVAWEKMKLIVQAFVDSDLNVCTCRDSGILLSYTQRWGTYI